MLNWVVCGVIAIGATWLVFHSLLYKDNKVGSKKPNMFKVVGASVAFWGLIVLINIVVHCYNAPVIKAGEDLADRTAKTNAVINETYNY